MPVPSYFPQVYAHAKQWLHPLLFRPDSVRKYRQMEEVCLDCPANRGSKTTDTIHLCPKEKGQAHACPSCSSTMQAYRCYLCFAFSSLSSLKFILSTSACQLASMILTETPTVPQLQCSSLLSIRTLTFAPVPDSPVSTRTL